MGKLRRYLKRIYYAIEYLQSYCTVTCSSHRVTLLLTKINFRQNKTKPCITELCLRSMLVYHAFLLCTVCLQVIFMIGSIARNFQVLVLVPSCVYALVASRLPCFVWNLFFWIIIMKSLKHVLGQVMWILVCIRPGGFSHWHGIHICACLLRHFFTKFGIAIWVGFHQRRRSPNYINWVYFGQIIVKSTQFGQNWALFFQKWY